MFVKFWKISSKRKMMKLNLKKIYFLTTKKNERTTNHTNSCTFISNIVACIFCSIETFILKKINERKQRVFRSSYFAEKSKLKQWNREPWNNKGHTTQSNSHFISKQNDCTTTIDDRFIIRKSIAWWCAWTIDWNIDLKEHSWPVCSI